MPRLLPALLALALLSPAAARAQGCCLTVQQAKPLEKPRGPTLQLDVIAPNAPASAGTSTSPLHPFALTQSTAPSLPFMPSAGRTAPGLGVTLNAPVAQGEGNISLSIGVRSVEPDFPHR